MPATPNATTRANRTSIIIIIVSIATRKKVWIDENCGEGAEWSWGGAADFGQRELCGYIDIEHMVGDF
jgi:hypothetical protein